MGADASKDGGDPLEALCNAMEQINGKMEGGGSASLNGQDVHKRLLEAKDLVPNTFASQPGFQEILDELERTKTSDLRAPAEVPKAKPAANLQAMAAEDIKPERFDFVFKTCADAKQWETGFEKLAQSKGLSVEDFDSATLVLKDCHGEDVEQGEDEEPIWENLQYPLSGYLFSKFHEAEDVSWGKDGSLIKKRIRQGDDEDVLCASKLKIKVTAASDGTSSITGFEPRTFHFVAGSGEVCDFLEIAAMHLTRGEGAMFTCSEQSLYTHSDLGVAATSTGKAVLTLQLEEVETISDPKNMSEDEKIKFGISQKELGSDLFRRGRINLALARYKTVLDLPVTVGSTGSEKVKQEDVRNLIRLCELNRAACYLKLGNHPEAKKSCDVVLSDDPGNLKALCRRAQCDMHSKNFEAAVADLKKVIELDPQNQTARTLLKESRAGQKDCDKESKGVFAKMLQDPKSSKKSDGKSTA